MEHFQMGRLTRIYKNLNLFRKKHINAFSTNITGRLFSEVSNVYQAQVDILIIRIDAETRLAAENAAAISAANAQLAAAQMRARAIESGFETMSCVFDPSGTRYFYQRRDDPGNV
jgi:enolase